MNKRLANAFRLTLAVVAAIVVSVFLTGCPEGGGGGGGTPPVYVDPVHTSFTLVPAQIYETGRAYEVSASVRETRGDEITINHMYTYRTLTTKSTDSSNPYASTYYDTDMSYNYYSGLPARVNYAMFIPGTAGLDIGDTTTPADTFNILKGYGTRTIRSQVMIGRAGETKPAWFNGLFILYSDYTSWKSQNKVGVKYWVRLEGYDYKLNDSYNIYIPLEIYFAGALASTDPYSDDSNPVITDPDNDYNPF
ncbi:MAG: hypothetical protein A2W80_18550 [Candidatus Riflebacteria bacterium GWC2_50_8]|nr:MAG: hypothetical protein A2W80_18550 [Candidatus Riflebacteria bacterium GWC2_50_8]